MDDLNRLADFPSARRPDFEKSFERRDIILTPLRPVRGSNAATAADIAACMYYVHFASQPSAANPFPAATLIRRVPGSADQWNVANIIPAAGQEGEVMIEMLGEGYRKFRAGAAAPQQRIERKPVPGPTLTRIMHVEGAGLWERIKSRRHKSDTATPTTEGEPATAARKKKKRDYVFDGLWTDAAGASCGRCEFKDEGGGKYLKCKYYPASYYSSASSAEKENSTLLSVIEFKPSAMGHKRSLSAPIDDENSLKAKMGMIVVHGPGQEMLDLLIAANMAAFVRRWDGWGRERAALGGW
ncbi:hypothetical protein FN846DRAFT_906979 [Sphaerosporella brunnea]|uniref:Uncharacterized protein n=1 Tax=Sphaerosporella brunnea TaxID=1250544 RepID=A0A5J5EXK8_9PEZI|nr:hypothetical protein FN846DRAFT_906979 [Sphaerosporella brunnea]